MNNIRTFPLVLVIEDAGDQVAPGEYLGGYPIVTAAQRMGLARYWLYRAAQWLHQQAWWFKPEEPADDLPVNIAIEIQPEHYRAILNRRKRAVPRASITLVPPSTTIPPDETVEFKV